MPPLTLEGETLGEKHKNFNQLVKNAVTDKSITLSKVDSDEGDVYNLLKIETASKTRNVDYILAVLKCDDMLYVSRAIKHSTWLITDQQYAHIVNPEYLHTQLFPHMLSKAIRKLLLNIRLQMKDEKRIEGFYTYFKDDTGEAYKWLLNCSIPFIQNVLENERDIPLHLFKRLCRRSVKFLQYYKKVERQSDWRTLKAVLFLLTSDTEEYLKVLDETKEYDLPSLGKKHTEIIMKKNPERILNNFAKYKGSVDLATVVKHMKKEEIKDFLLANVKKDGMEYFFSNFENLKPFIKNIPREERFEFVKKIYIDKEETNRDTKSYDQIHYCCAKSFPSCSKSTYHWYQYAPFNVAFVELKKSIRAESSPAERTAMLSVLITCAKNNPQNIKILLQHYYEKHRNEPFKFKIHFVNNVIKYLPTHEFDPDTWSILDKLFHSLEVYIESNNDVQNCVRAVILYKLLHDEKVPDIVEKKHATFDTLHNTFSKIKSKLTMDQQNKLFSYLLTTLRSKIQSLTIANESDFNKVRDLLTSVLNLIIDWKKDLKDYIFVREKIQELFKLKKENSWESSDLSSLYNLNKSCRRQMFDESMMMYPSEEVCLNALKHGPQLLTRHKDELDTLRTDDQVSLRRLLAKLRIYWPQSLAQEWTDAYLNNMDDATGHEAIIRGLFVLLSQKELTDMAKKYAPQETKIDWSEIDQNELSVRKSIAKHLYLARPLTPVDTVLLYAKGDYLQFTVPSLNAILYNLSTVQSRKHMSKLLEAPVSLQKFGLHLAFIKLKKEELKPLFSNIWKNTKNSTIRTHLFMHTYNLLCKVKDAVLAKELWELLKMFIDNLTIDDNKMIFGKLGNMKNIHICVQGEFYVKSYEFMSSLPASANCENYVDNLLDYAPNIMNLLDKDFVTDKILTNVEEKMSTIRSRHLDVMTAFVLHGQTEEEQCERFRKVLKPALEHAFNSLNLVKNGEYVMKHNFDSILKSLTWDFRKFISQKKIVAPVKLFSEIQQCMEQKLPLQENYIRYTCWKLTTDYVKLFAEYKDILCDAKLDKLKAADFRNGWLPDEVENVWEALNTKIAPKMGTTVAKYLKKDIETYFPTIYCMFCDALRKMFDNLSFNRNFSKIEILKYMITDDDFVPSYIVVCEEIPKYGDDDDKVKRSEIRKMIIAHPSLEVKMHYERAFSECHDD